MFIFLNHILIIIDYQLLSTMIVLSPILIPKLHISNQISIPKFQIHVIYY